MLVEVHGDDDAVEGADPGHPWNHIPMPLRPCREDDVVEARLRVPREVPTGWNLRRMRGGRGAAVHLADAADLVEGVVQLDVHLCRGLALAGHLAGGRC